MTLTTDVLAIEGATALPGSDEDPGDSGYGWAMFLGFLTAALAITFAVCVLALAQSWWVLGVAVAAHWGITAVMIRVVYGAFESPAYPDLERVQAADPGQVTDLETRRASLATHH